jgi:peptidoglycan/LPS O-acetylase OafA/YrhL
MDDLRLAQKKLRPELEGIRALAAFLVAVYHIWLGSPLHISRWILKSINKKVL